jgi:multidrug efflux pump subunit AcrB
MIVSYFLAQTFVPIMANWIMKVKHHHAPDGHELTDNEEFAQSGLTGDDRAAQLKQKELAANTADRNHNGKVGGFERMRMRYLRFIDRMMPYRKIIVFGYVIVICGLAFILMQSIGRDVLPKVNGSQFQVRLRAPEGTRIEQTETRTYKAINIIKDLVGPENVSITSAYVGTHPSLFSTSPIYLWMAGPQEAVIQVAFKEGFKTNLDELKEKIRAAYAKQLPDVKSSFRAD